MKILKANSRKSQLIRKLREENSRQIEEFRKQLDECMDSARAWKFRYAKLKDREDEFSKDALRLQGEVDKMREALKVYRELHSAVNRFNNHFEEIQKNEPSKRGSRIL